MTLRRRLTAAILAPALLLATAATAHAQDVYIGTVKAERGQVVLTRCDLAQNRYVLREPATEKPVAALAARLATLKAPVHAEVIGEYEEDGDGNALKVIEIQGVEAGKSCHLLDAPSALDDASKPAKDAAALPAPGADRFGAPLRAAVGAPLVPPRDYAKGPQRPDPADYDPNTSGIIYDVAFASASDGRVAFEVRGYSGDDQIHPASGQIQDFPEAQKEVNVRDLAIRIDAVTPEAITYRIRIEPQEAIAAPRCPQDCQPSVVGQDAPSR